jgi:hypothetical protein
MLSLGRSYYNLFPMGVGVQVDWRRTAMPANDLRRFIATGGEVS